MILSDLEAVLYLVEQLRVELRDDGAASPGVVGGPQLVVQPQRRVGLRGARPARGARPGPARTRARPDTGPGHGDEGEVDDEGVRKFTEKEREKITLFSKLFSSQPTSGGEAKLTLSRECQIFRKRKWQLRAFHYF